MSINFGAFGVITIPNDHWNSVYVYVTVTICPLARADRKQQIILFSRISAILLPFRLETS